MYNFILVIKIVLMARQLDEQDMFESDFESTDEEAEKRIEEAGEAEVVQEEMQMRKVYLFAAS